MVIVKAVRTQRIPHLESIVKKLNKKGASLELHVNRTPCFKRFKDEMGTYVESFNEVSLSGSDIALNGWLPIAKVEMLPSGAPLVLAFRDSEPVLEYMAPRHALVCEHCNKIRTRKNFVLLKHQNGETKLVGSSCLVDFIGKGGAEYLLNLANLIPHFSEENEEGGFNVGRASAEVAPPLLYAITKLLMSQFGYISRRKGEELNVVDTPTTIRSEYSKLIRYITDENLAEATVEFNAAMERLEKNISETKKVSELTFLRNMHTLNRELYVEGKAFGIAAYLAEWYRTQLERDIVKAAEASRVSGGKCPKGSHTLQGTVLSIKLVDTDYGVATKCLIEDTRGFRVYGTLPKAVSSAQVGDTIKFTAIVSPSQDDEQFGFYSRPTQAEMVQAASAS